MDLSVLSDPDRRILRRAYPPAAAISSRVEDLLRRSSYLALRDVSCVALGGALHLRGCLPSYYLKQVAQEVAASVAGSRRVINRIEVSVSAGRTPVGCDWVPDSAATPYRTEGN
jgi:osmotically-inducible protein OsmY